MALRNSQFDILMRSYNQKQFKNKHDLDRRIEEVYKKVPRIQEINEEMASASIAQAKEMLLKGSTSALETLHKRLEDLSKEKVHLLASFGYPPNYLQMQYECPDCQDTGFIRGEKCHCFKQATIDMLYMQSNLRDILKEENFQSFTFQYYDNSVKNRITGKTAYENMRDIFLICKNFVTDFEKQTQNLLFFGDTGIGKTFLSHCIARELLESSHSVIYLSAIELFDLFSRHTFESETDFATAALLEYILECELFIIDDLGTELSNSFTNSKLFYCLNERLSRKRSTIISTNLTLEHITQIYSERISSRIFSNYIPLKFYGDDIRIKKKLLANRP